VKAKKKLRRNLIAVFLALTLVESTGINTFAMSNSPPPSTDVFRGGVPQESSYYPNPPQGGSGVEYNGCATRF
jgi:hypothetical protein